MRNGFYTSWVSIIGRRFKAGKIKSENDLKQAYVDVMKKKLIRDFHKEAPEDLNRNDVANAHGGWDNANAKPWRNAAYDQGLVPSSYGAANVDELWATAVEDAALGGNVPPKLKKLIWNTINGH